MSGSFRVESLHSEIFLKEIHYLLWRAPFRNNGVPDCGWNCRDHALIVALLLRNFGIQSGVCFGKMALVTGPDGNERPAINAIDPHSWNFIPGADWLDTSVRVPREVSSWRHWKVDSVFGRSVQANLATTHSVMKSPVDFENNVNAAKNSPGARALIYLVQGITDADKIPLDDLNRWVNSPHSRRMAAEFASDRLIYLKAAYHLLMLLEGKRETLTTIVKSEVWRHISRISDEEVISAMPTLCQV